MATHELLAREIAAFDSMKASLEANHKGKFVVVHDEKLIGTWDTLDAAAKQAVVLFGRGPYLIRQVGAPPIHTPASVMFHNFHPA